MSDIDLAYDLLNGSTDGYVRQSADGRWSWKCDGCSTANSPYDTKLDASEALEDHAEDCPA